mmetsp:Transcript_19915/g.43263  ORF Transcript_19915/g.43263 Transcript_19915/m.43263 type:complete len:221 (-) Transcript_19915:28-690(-)
MPALDHLLEAHLAFAHLRGKDLGHDTEEQREDDHTANGDDDAEETTRRSYLALRWGTRGPDENSPDGVGWGLAHKDCVRGRSKDDQSHRQKHEYQAGCVVDRREPIRKAVSNIIDERILAAGEVLVVVGPLQVNDGHRIEHEEEKRHEEQRAPDVVQGPAEELKVPIFSLLRLRTFEVFALLEEGRGVPHIRTPKGLSIHRRGIRGAKLVRCEPVAAVTA